MNSQSQLKNNFKQEELTKCEPKKIIFKNIKTFRRP